VRALPPLMDVRRHCGLAAGRPMERRQFQLQMSLKFGPYPVSEVQ
jgi:hypothetical protein